ncbi:MAG: hypothetical protein GY929_15870 [Actinomycetia bacterium]|nr:hypothetical protein [Actinomycetes bacterium]
MITAMPRIAIAVNDYHAAVATFQDVLGMPFLDMSAETVTSLGAHVGMCQPPGGSNIELMAPADPDRALSQALQRFLDSRGEGFYALMLEAPDPDAEAEELLARDVEVLPLMEGAGGRDIHPRSTHGVLIRVYPDNSVPNREGAVSAAPGLSGVTRGIIATSDAVKAADAYGRGLGLEVDDPIEDRGRGVLVVVCHPAKGGVIELVSAIDTSIPFAREINQFVEEKGGGIYALVLEVDDPMAAASVLAERGVEVGGHSGLEASVFGARILLNPRS